jgi:hypothetical protein
MSYSRNEDDAQWLDNITSGGVTHYTFAHLDQTTISLTFRLDYTASPTLTLQIYANPFVSKGTYSDVREVVNARADHYDDRFAPYALGRDPGGFDVRQFNSSTVLRWEYDPGSSLYLVWTQGRQNFEPGSEPPPLSDDFDQLFHAHPANTFLVKAVHWFDW